MKNSATTKQIQEKPKRLTRAEKQSTKLAQKASEQLELCRQTGAFHMAYLEAELEREAAYHNALQARIAQLKPETVETIETVETVEVVETVAKEEGDIFDTLAEETRD